MTHEQSFWYEILLLPVLGGELGSCVCVMGLTIIIVIICLIITLSYDNPKKILS